MLNLLAQKYWPPIYQFLLCQGMSEDEAKDTVQDFFEFALKSHLFEKADRKKGRLRSFLLVALKHFAANAHRRRSARKRGPPGGVVSLDQLLEDAYFHPSALVQEDVQEDPSDKKFRDAWLHSVVENALRELREEFEKDGMQTHFELFRARIVAPELEDSDPPPLTRLASELGLEFKKADGQITTAKRAFKRILLREVANHTMCEEDTAEEMRDVLHFLRLEE